MRIATRAIALVTISISTITSTPIADAAGRSATAAVNTILNGKGAPKGSLGIDGDFYIDTRSLLIYGPKIKGKWPTPKSIQGPTGPSGSDGKNGSDGKSASTANINSVSGPQGIQGEKGEKGEAGLPGAPGAMGPAGPAGAIGPAGSPGASGSNGAQGPAGPAGATGSAGAQGPAGAKGETGTAGITNLIYGQLTFSDLSGGIGTGVDVQIAGFESGKKYLVNLQIISFQPNDLNEYFLPLSLSITSTTSNVISQSSYLLVHGYSYRAGSNRYENSIIAEIVLDGSSANVSYGINLQVASGRNTSGTELVRISGNYTIQEVQTVQNHA
ncbi:Collagen triple helix repeat [Candidatus Nanopelagicaceae bacterium]